MSVLLPREKRNGREATIALNSSSSVFLSRIPSPLVRDSGSSVTRASDGVLFAVNSAFEIEEKERVLPVLSKNPVLCSAIFMVLPFVQEMFPDSHPTLECVCDPEARNPDYLAINIPTSLSAEEAFPLWLAIQKRIIHIVANCNGSLSVDLRYR